jgi:excisionase family DNA binding protein
MAGTALPTTSDSGTAYGGHDILTVIEVARELRCSKAHVHHLITGRVPGVRPLPSLWLGRRRLILRASLEEWVRANEKAPASVL